MEFKKLLEKRGYTIKTFAQKLGFNYTRVYSWVSQKAMPRAADLDKVAHALGETADGIIKILKEGAGTK